MPNRRRAVVPFGSELACLTDRLRVQAGEYLRSSPAIQFAKRECDTPGCRRCQLASKDFNGPRMGIRMSSRMRPVFAAPLLFTGQIMISNESGVRRTETTTSRPAAVKRTPDHPRSYRDAELVPGNAAAVRIRLDSRCSCQVLKAAGHGCNRWIA